MDCFTIEHQGTSTDADAFGRAPHPGANSFEDQVAFEIRDGAYDDHDRPARRTAMSICSRKLKLDI